MRRAPVGWSAILFEQRYLLTYHSLGDAQPLGSACEGAGVNYSREIGQTIEVHGDDPTQCTSMTYSLSVLLAFCNHSLGVQSRHLMDWIDGESFRL